MGYGGMCERIFLVISPILVIVPVLGITMTAMNRDELWGASCESTGF
jgi:hypothetical protein